MEKLGLLVEKKEEIAKFLIITRQKNYSCSNWRDASKKIAALKILGIQYIVFYRNADNSYSELLVNVDEVKCFD